MEREILSKYVNSERVQYLNPTGKVIFQVCMDRKSNSRLQETYSPVTLCVLPPTVGNLAGTVGVLPGNVGILPLTVGNLPAL